MLSSIHPLGERGRRQRWGITVTAYVAASAAAGTAVGAAAGMVGGVALPDHGGRAALAVAALACGVAAVADARGARVPWVRRQVDEMWLQAYRGWAYGAGFGAQLGSGVATTITTTGVPLFVALATLTASPALGGAVGGCFGVVRAAPLVLLPRVHRPGQLWRRHARMAAAAPAVRTATVTALAALAVVLGAGAVA